MERQKRVLQFLYRNNRWFHGRELAGIFGVSTRTIRNDIATINLGSSKPLVLTDQMKGYRYGFESTEEKRESVIPGTYQERILHEVKTLLIAESFCLFEMAEALAISEATVDIDMTRFRKFLIEYAFDEVKLSKRGNRWLMQGAECYKNNILYELGRYLYHDFSVELFEALFTDFKGICQLVQDNANLNYKENRYLRIAELCLDFAILLERSKGRFAGSPEKAFESVDSFVINTINDIQNRYQTILDTEGVAKLIEKIQAAEQLSLFESRLRPGFDNNKDLQELYTILAEELREIYRIDLSTCEILYQNMILHIYLAVKRLQTGYKYYNPLKEQILDRYPFVIDIALYLAHRVEGLFKIKIDSNDLSFLVAYLGGILGMVYQDSLKDTGFGILLISFEGRSHMLHLNRYINKLLGTQKHFIVEINSHLEYNMLAELPRAHDIAIYLGEENAAIPADLYLSVGFSAMDKTRLAEKLESRADELRKEKFNNIFQRYFDEELFMMKDEIECREKIIFSLTEKMVKKGITDSDFFASVMARETIIPTSLDIQAALPHALSYDAKATKIAIAVLRQPVKWGAHKVRVVFLLASALKDEDQLHLFVEFLSESLAHENSRERLRQVESFNDIRNFFFDCFMRG